jgi:hypothetical protein
VTHEKYCADCDALIPDAVNDHVCLACFDKWSGPSVDQLFAEAESEEAA